MSGPSKLISGLCLSDLIIASLGAFIYIVLREMGTVNSTDVSWYISINNNLYLTTNHTAYDGTMPSYPMPTNLVCSLFHLLYRYYYYYYYHG